MNGCVTLLALRRAGFVSAVLLWAFLVPGVGRAWAQEVEFSVQVEPRTAEVGELVRVVVTAEGAGAADCALLETPVLPGLTLTPVGPPESSQSLVAVNGRVSRTIKTIWRFQLVPRAEGLLELPPFRLECRGEALDTERTSVFVTPATDERDRVRLTVESSDVTVWVGQIFHLDLAAYLDEDVTEKLLDGGWYLDLPWFDGLTGLVRLDAETPRNNLRHVPLSDGRRKLGMEMSGVSTDGRTWIRLALRVPMLASRSGHLEIPASRFVAKIATGFERQRDPFSIFGGSRQVVTRAIVAESIAPALVLDVREPPLDTRPRAYTNAVGSFELKGAALPRSVRVGDPVTISLKLTGEGNLEFLEWPPFDELSEDFRIFGKEEQDTGDARVIAIEVSPKSSRVTEIPKLEVGVFDPEQGDYEVLSVGPFPLEVTADANEGLAELSVPDEILNDLETIRERLPAPIEGRRPAWLWVLPGLLLFAGVELRGRVSRWRAANPEAIRRRGARRALEEELKQVDGVGDVAAAFARFLAARLGGPPAGLSAQEAAERLDDEELADELCRTVAVWEAAYLGGSQLDTNIAWSEARHLAERVEQTT